MDVKVVLEQERIHRLSGRDLADIVSQVNDLAPLAPGQRAALTYFDDTGDRITVRSDEEVHLAVEYLRAPKFYWHVREPEVIAVPLQLRASRPLTWQHKLLAQETETSLVTLDQAGQLERRVLPAPIKAVYVSGLFAFVALPGNLCVFGGLGLQEGCIMFPTEGRVAAVCAGADHVYWLEYLDDKTSTVCTASAKDAAVRRPLGECGKPVAFFRIQNGRYKGFLACSSGSSYWSCRSWTLSKTKRSCLGFTALCWTRVRSQVDCTFW